MVGWLAQSWTAQDQLRIETTTVLRKGELSWSGVKIGAARKKNDLGKDPHPVGDDGLERIGSSQPRKGNYPTVVVSVG